MSWRLWALAIALLALLAYVLAGAGRDALSREAPTRTESRPAADSTALRKAEAPGIPAERDVLAVAQRPAAEPAAGTLVERLEDWESATDGVLEGRLIATRGIESWKAWRVYLTSRAPGVSAFKAQKHVDVDELTGFFRIDEIPLGKAELIWYHPEAGKLSERLAVEIESGLNTVEMRYEGPDPQASIFVSVHCDEPVAPSAITATDGARIFWAEALAEYYFAIPVPTQGSYRVKIEQPGRKVHEYQAEAGSRLRVEIE